MVAVNQTESQKDEVFRDNKCYCTYKRLATKYKHLQAQFT